MSATGSRLDVIAARARSALGIPALDARVERAAPVHEWWNIAADAMPHGFIHSPGRTSSPARGGQVVRSFDTGFVLVVDGTQEQALTILEAFEAQIDADPTLGGLTIGAHVSNADLHEMESTPRRCIVGVVSWTEES